MQQRAGSSLHVRNDECLREPLASDRPQNDRHQDGAGRSSMTAGVETPAGPLGQPRHFDDGPDAQNINGKSCGKQGSTCKGPGPERLTPAFARGMSSGPTRGGMAIGMKKARQIKIIKLRFRFRWKRNGAVFAAERGNCCNSPSRPRIVSRLASGGLRHRMRIAAGRRRAQRNSRRSRRP